MNQAPEASVNIFVARQPVFDACKRIWGYELLFRQSDAVNKAVITDAEIATQSVIADGYAMAFSGVPGSVMCLVNFSRGLLLQDTALALPPENTVVEILETVEPTPEIVEAGKKLKSLGYKIALDDFVGDPGYEPLLEMADLIKVDVLNMDENEIVQVAEMLRPYKGRLLAEKVEDNAVFAVCRDAGFTLFQGFFFSRPEIIPGRKLALGELSKLELLKELAREDIDFVRLAEIIQTDVSLTYRLLRHINSAAFSFTQKVESIQRALTLMGHKRLAEWLRVVIVTEMGKGDIGREIVAMSAKRGKFLQYLAPEIKLGLSPESLFLLGFLSLLDVLLRQPMPDIVKNLPLSPELREALIDQYAAAHRLIILNELQERAQWDAVGRLLGELDMDVHKSAQAFIAARKWADDMLGNI